METLIESIRAALVDDASDDARHQGALACRTILAVLEPDDAAPRPPAVLTSAAFADTVRSMQALHDALARLRDTLPS